MPKDRPSTAVERALKKKKDRPRVWPRTGGNKTAVDSYVGGPRASMWCACCLPDRRSCFFEQSQQLNAAMHQRARCCCCCNRFGSPKMKQRMYSFVEDAGLLRIVRLDPCVRRTSRRGSYMETFLLLAAFAALSLCRALLYQSLSRLITGRLPLCVRSGFQGAYGKQVEGSQIGSSFDVHEYSASTSAFTWQKCG